MLLLLDRIEGAWQIADIAFLIHDLVLTGAIAAPTHPRYAIGLAFAYGGYRNWLNDERWYDRSPHDKNSPIVDRIRENIDGLRPAIWRQFEVEGDDQISLIVCQIKRESVEGGWAAALKALSDEELLDRHRLLDATLQALARGFTAYRARWFLLFHELMRPTADEQAARAGLYLDLLASPVPQIVAFAVAILQKVAKTGKLDPARVIERIEPALYCSTKAGANGALALLLEAAKQRPDLTAVALPLLTVCLEQKATDVQERAIEALEAHSAAFDETTRKSIEARLDVMSSALRPRALALTGGERSTADTPTRSGSAGSKLARPYRSNSTNPSHFGGHRRGDGSTAHRNAGRAEGQV